MLEKGEVYGIDRLKEVVQEVKIPSAHQLRNKIVHSVQSFSKKSKIERDISVMVMEIRDRILKLT